MENKSIPMLENMSAQLSQDGKLIAFKLNTKSGKEFDCALKVADAQKFLQVTISILQDAATKHAASDQGAAKPPESLTANPINARSIGFACGRTTNESLIALDLGPFQLTFSVPTSLPSRTN